jgi:diadenosine tetraphosphate (Ap4A) HIT family hydrolase
MPPEFEKQLVKKYKCWKIYVHENQGYLGRCIIWCTRADAHDLTNSTPEELSEFIDILRNLRAAEQKIFQPDWFNYSFLGNDTRHLHAHFIPRYASPKTFSGIVFEDKLYGHNYKTDHSFHTTQELLFSVRDALKAAL